MEPEQVLELISSAPERYESVRAALRYLGDGPVHKEIRERIVRRAFRVSSEEAPEHPFECLLVEQQLVVSARVEALDAVPEVIDRGPRLRTELTLSHKRPLLLYHHLGVGVSEFLDMTTLGLGQLVGDPENLCHLVGLVVRDDLGRLPLFPYSDEHEPKQHGVCDAQDGVDESRHVVLPLPDSYGHHTLHQEEPANRNQNEQTYQQ
jgi:hypothetical protein